MTTEAFKNWLKTVVDSPSFTIGKLDTSKSQTICVYSGLSSGVNKPKLGNASGYGEKSIRILVRWGNNSAKAEEKAQQVYNLLAANNPIIHDGKIAFAIPKYAEPVSLGTDDKNIYEFSIDVNLFYER